MNYYLNGSSCVSINTGPHKYLDKIVKLINSSILCIICTNKIGIIKSINNILMN